MLKIFQSDAKKWLIAGSVLARIIHEPHGI